MATVLYPAQAMGDRTAGYTAVFPDLPGCTATAATLGELLAAAREALQRRLEELTAEGLEWPYPSEIEDLPPPADGRAAGALLVDVDVEDAPVRVNISIGERLLKRIDQAAEQRSMTRSGFIALACRDLLGEGGARPEFDARKVQESLADYVRSLQEKFGPESEFARSFHDLDRKITRHAESFALQVAAALRGKGPTPEAGPTTRAADAEESADTRP